MDLAQWLSLAGICLLGAMSPGPSLAVIANTSVSQGRRSGYAASIAHGCAVALYALLTVTGLGALIAKSPSLLTPIQVGGGMYLVYLGIKLLSSKSTGAVTLQDSKFDSAAFRGFLVALLNPKLMIFMLALFSQYLEAGAGVGEKALMVATAGLIDAVWYCLVVMLIAGAGFPGKLEASAVTIDRVFGLLLIGLALSVLLGASGLM